MCSLPLLFDSQRKCNAFVLVGGYVKVRITFFSSALITKLQENQERLQMNGAFQLLMHTEDLTFDSTLKCLKKRTRSSDVLLHSSGNFSSICSLPPSELWPNEKSVVRSFFQNAGNYLHGVISQKTLISIASGL
jgi:hypothetical protein